ncbi:response regulator [Rhizobium sp. NRK18]|uniref:response regulator n=1 Tax=Rhizobium sp. NRK18 TaxID=2964667 RepID=UPI0021C29732|nr:response regulator [Rhizobium sp. NRK18]MCQ2003382.1 response regulator [Rhizobium sp. NRK18]
MNKPQHDVQPILMVEDSEDDFEATMRAFRRANLRNPILRAASGDEAIELLDNAKHKPGLILLDLNMPGMDGRQLLTVLKQREDTRKTPVVILTTSDDERDVDACYQLGANTYIQKPVNLDGLFAAIQRLKEYWFEIAILPRED